jgi:hypothetical protein
MGDGRVGVTLRQAQGDMVSLPNHPLTSILSHQRLCRNWGFEMFVILNEVKNLIISIESII